MITWSLSDKWLVLAGGLALSGFLFLQPLPVQAQGLNQGLKLQPPLSNDASGQLAWDLSDRMRELGMFRNLNGWMFYGHPEFERLNGEWVEENLAHFGREADSLRTLALQWSERGRVGREPLGEEELAHLATLTNLVERMEKNVAEVDLATKKFDEAIGRETERRRGQCKPTATLFCPILLKEDVARDMPLPPDLRSLLAYRLGPDVKSEPLLDSPLVAKIDGVEVSNKPYEVALEEAEAGVRNAAYDYDIAQQDEESVRQRFQKNLKEHSARISSQNKILDAAQKKLKALRRVNFVPNLRIADVKKSANYTNILSQIKTEESTVARLLERIEQVKSWGGNSTSLQTLADAIKKPERKILELEQQRVKMLKPGKEPSYQGPETPKMTDLRVTIADSQRVKKKANIALEVVSETLLENYERLQEVDQLYADALQKLGALKGKEAKPLLQIKTNDTFDARFTNRRAEMKDLNRAIKVTRQAVRDADYQRELARSTMLEANEDTSNASEILEKAIIDSASSQLALEAYMQAKEGLDASKAGPGVFLLWASNRVAQNIFNPPKVYEPEYRLDGQQSVSQQILESYFVKDAQQAMERTTKYGTTKIYDHLGATTSDTLKLGQIENEMQKIVSGQRATSSTKSLASLLTRFKAQEKVYDSAAKSLSARLYGSGKAKLAGSISTSLLGSQLKSIGVEAIKRELADFFEGQAWRSYMRANQRFVLAVRVFRASGNIYWENRDTLDGLVALRKAIKQKFYDQKSKLQIEKSEEFDVKEEMRFWLSFADEKGELSSDPHPGNVTAFLDNVQLKRKPNSNIFDLTRASAKTLRKQGNKNLTFRVVFE